MCYLILCIMCDKDIACMLYDQDFLCNWTPKIEFNFSSSYLCVYVCARGRIYIIDGPAI